MVRKACQAFLAYHHIFGPAAPLVLLLTLACTIFSVSRLALSLVYLDRVLYEPRFYLMYLIGMRIDLIVCCYMLCLPAVFFFVLPKRLNQHLQYVWIFYLTLCIDIILFLEIVTWPFLQEYDLRPESIFLRYLPYYREVAGTLWGAYTWKLGIPPLLVLLGHRLAWRACRQVVTAYRPLAWPYRLALFPVLGACLFLGARSSLAPRPANISTAYFSTKSKLVNEFTLNSTYSVALALILLANERNPAMAYGHMEEPEILQRVYDKTFLADALAVPSDIPFLHQQQSTLRRTRPLNVVIILEESLGAEYVGALGGLPLTPNLDRLSREGLLFTNLYATGTRTVRGIEATITGFLPTPGSSVVNLGLSRHNFFTAGALFKQHGYITEFIYGGESNFDEMQSFFLGNGFTALHDQSTFRDYVFKGVWGVSDEDLMVQAHGIFCAHGDTPFFAVLLSTSNHTPFEFPDGRITLYDQPKNTVHNAIKYADYALGKFFALARQAPYYANTLFLVVADHDTRVFGDEFVPVHKFHIPGVLVGPDVPAQAYDKVASQIDLLPTLLHYAGLTVTHPMIGRDLMTLPAAEPGRAFLQYGMKV